MARSTRSKPPSSPARLIRPAPANLGTRQNHWLETDAYDRATFRTLVADSPSWHTLIESGSKLLPHFDGFVLDLFGMCFKLNLVLHANTDVLPSAGFYRLVIDQLLQLPVVASVRHVTTLDEHRAGLASLLLGERLLALLKSERILGRADMLDFWNLDQRERELAADAAHTATANDLQRVATSGTQRQLGELVQRLQRQANASSVRLDQQAVQVQSAARDSLERNRHRVETEAHAILDALRQDGDACEGWDVALGGNGPRSPGAQVELSKRLVTNPKLQTLATLLGRMRTRALGLRRKKFERAAAETYDVALGADLGRLLPPELLALSHPILRRDVHRRFLDSQLRQYALRARDDRSRGPMICCLDCSSSMAGDKEIWAKAVSLTLLEIAQRQHRRFRSICFASADTPLQELDLNPRQRYAADQRSVLELAEYFPGGGTDFEKPLTAALGYLRQARYKRGDIVFITDGECRVGPEWLREFLHAKSQLGFSVVSVLIDVGATSLAALQDFSDEITTVTQLNSDATRDLFLKL